MPSGDTTRAQPCRGRGSARYADGAAAARRRTFSPLLGAVSAAPRPRRRATRPAARARARCAPRGGESTARRTSLSPEQLGPRRPTARRRRPGDGPLRRSGAAGPRDVGGEVRGSAGGSGIRRLRRLQLASDRHLAAAPCGPASPRFAASPAPPRCSCPPLATPGGCCFVVVARVFFVLGESGQSPSFQHTVGIKCHASCDCSLSFLRESRPAGDDDHPADAQCSFGVI